MLALALAALAASPRETSIDVGVDARVELLAIVQHLSGYGGRTGLITRYDVAYKREVEEAFGRHRDHEAVKLFDAMSQRGFAYDAPVAWILHFGPPPALAERAEMDEAIASRAGSSEDQGQLLDALRDFAKEAALAGFLADRAPYFDGLVTDVKKEIADLDPSMLESYFGETRAAYRIVLSPLLHHGAFGPRVRTGEGGWEIYSVGGPHGAKDGRPSFGTADDFRYLVWHEFSHSFVNPLVDASGDAVDRCAAAFEPLRSAMKEQAYGTWRNCVQEHVVRACTVRLAHRELGKEAGVRAADDERSRRFVHVDALAKRLETYERDRARYPKLADFFPELIAVFQDAASKTGTSPARRAPRVIGSIPRAGDDAVDPSLTEILLHFDQDMNPKSWSWIQRDAASFPPKTADPRFLTLRTCVLPVKLAPGRAYWVGANQGRMLGFVGTSGTPAQEFVLEFTTTAERAR